MKLPPDFAADGPIRFTHRREGGADIYFLANRTADSRGNQMPVSGHGQATGTVRPDDGYDANAAGFFRDGGRTVIPLRFEPGQSFFSYFGQPVAMKENAAKNFNRLQAAGELNGSWEVSFDPKWGGPGENHIRRAG